ncbi:MAG: hypothetical protein OFPI_41570 [Osedax symbiont Rs2]|nr:MAG: hypothetical protein OFPI_41570 [Osedax symbiont Rs2]
MLRQKIQLHKKFECFCSSANSALYLGNMRFLQAYGVCLANH